MLLFYRKVYSGLETLSNLPKVTVCGRVIEFKFTFTDSRVHLIMSRHYAVLIRAKKSSANYLLRICKRNSKNILKVEVFFNIHWKRVGNCTFVYAYVLSVYKQQ